MEEIQCMTCGHVFTPSVFGYGEVNTTCPCCGDDTAAPVGLEEEEFYEEEF